MHVRLFQEKPPETWPTLLCHLLFLLFSGWLLLPVSPFCMAPPIPYERDFLDFS